MYDTKDGSSLKKVSISRRTMRAGKSLQGENLLSEALTGVGERCVRGEVRSEGLMDFTQVRMPE